MKIRIKSVIIVITVLIILINENFAQSSINGQLDIDSTWNNVIYLSLIFNFDQLNTMSNQMIIESSEVDKQGRFHFITDYLPAENNTYRIHLSKKGDPPASLIIGGKDENYIFVIANNQSTISIKNSNSEKQFQLRMQNTVILFYLELPVWF